MEGGKSGGGLCYGYRVLKSLAGGTSRRANEKSSQWKLRSWNATVRGDPMEPFFRDITIERQFATGTQSETRLIGVQGGTVSGLRPDGGPSVADLEET